MSAETARARACESELHALHGRVLRAASDGRTSLLTEIRFKTNIRKLRALGYHVHRAWRRWRITW
ncbi:MAG: hypothetical protein ACPGR8_06265 [Limisphaerales bacterium]